MPFREYNKMMLIDDPYTEKELISVSGASSPGVRGMTHPTFLKS